MVSSNVCEVPARAPVIPRTAAAKNGSVKNRSSDSEITRVTESFRRVTSERAALFGTYPRASTAAITAAWLRALTLGAPLMARETVPRPTPARAATSSRVGRRLGSADLSFM